MFNINIIEIFKFYGFRTDRRSLFQVGTVEEEWAEPSFVSLQRHILRVKH